MAKKYDPSKISKRQQAQNSRKNLLEIWVDGCYFDQQNLAGGAGIICVDGKIKSIVSFELNHLSIDQSKYAELWAAAHVLESLKPRSVGRISTDCPTVKARINQIRAGGTKTHGDQPELLERLTAAVLAQPQMHINLVRRSVGKMPLADKFAKSAAKSDADDLEKMARHFGSHDHLFTPSPKP